MRELTLEDLKNYTKMCRETTYKGIRLGGIVFIPSALCDACDALIKKIPFVSAGITEISPAEKIFLELVIEEIGKD